jgi:maleylacetate reductase
MQSGTMVFTAMNRVIFGQPAAAAIVAEADRLQARRVFVLTGRTLNTRTDEIDKVRAALGDRFAGVHDDMPAHTPRDSVVACANAARAAGTDLLVTFGGGSVTDGGKAVTICLEHGISDVAGLEPFRSVVADGKRRIPEFRSPRAPGRGADHAVGRRVQRPRRGHRYAREAQAGLHQPRHRARVGDPRS